MDWLRAPRDDEEMRILRANRDLLLIDVVLYFERPVEELRAEVETFPFYEREVISHPAPSLLRRLRGAKPREDQVLEYFAGEELDEFSENKVRIDIVNISYYTTPGEFFGHTIENPCKKAPLIDHAPFAPASAIDVSFLGPEQALQLKNFYLEHERQFTNRGLAPYGFLLLRGADLARTQQALARLDEKYACLRTEEQRAMVFMSSQ